MNLHEYQSKQILKSFGVGIQEGIVAESPEKAVEAAKALGRIDILINNVGMGNYKTLVNTSLDDYVEMMDVNVRTTFLFTRHVAPVMIKQGEGLILMVSSMAGVYPVETRVAYRHAMKRLPLFFRSTYHRGA